MQGHCQPAPCVAVVGDERFRASEKDVAHHVVFGRRPLVHFGGATSIRAPRALVGDIGILVADCFCYDGDLCYLSRILLYHSTIQYIQLQ
jgi:hypothetical protein